jgi:hypothetical protein
MPGSTLDVDLWIDLPSRQYMTVVKAAVRAGAVMLRDMVVELADGTLVNFIFAVSGVGSFAAELRKARRLNFGGCEVPVMSLPSIRKNKVAVMRDKDIAHIHLIDQFLGLQPKRKAGQ